MTDLRVLDIDPSGKARTTIDLAAVGPPPSGGLRWIDVSDQDAEHVALLGERFGFHPLALEDLLNLNQRAKLDEYRDHRFLVMHGFSIDLEQDCELQKIELHLFIGPGYLITVHTETVPGLDSVWRRVEIEPELASRGSDFLCYLVTDALVDSFFPLVNDIANRVDEIEDVVLSGGGQQELPSIFALKRTLVALRNLLGPQRDVFALLARHSSSDTNGDRTSVYFRDVYDHLIRIHESIEATRDLLGNALDAYLWAASQRTNDIMKRLTLVSVVFMPLTFITGFFGQNFEMLPFGSHGMMWFMLAACVVVPIAMVAFFKQRDWL